MGGAGIPAGLAGIAARATEGHQLSVDRYCRFMLDCWPLSGFCPLPVRAPAIDGHERERHLAGGTTRT